MKTLYKNIKGIVHALLLACCCFGAASCDDDVNDWGVDSEYEALFRPLTFESIETNSTATLISYTKIVSAEKYVFEFFADSCEFLTENYFRSDTILSDTLTAFADSDSPMSVQYRTWFTELNGSTQYCVRMKGLAADGLESGYVEAAFLTPAEQLFEDLETTTNSVTLTWKPTDNITHLLLFEKNVETWPRVLAAEGEGGGLDEGGQLEYKDPVRIGLTAADKAACSKTIDGLPSGTNYKVQIMNNDVVRGEFIFKTLGLGAGMVINVPQSSSANDTIDMEQLFLDNQVQGTGNLTLQFEPGGLYNLGTWALPAVDNLLITSTSADEENRPHILTESIQVASSLQSLSFNYIFLDGNNQKDMMLEISKASIGSITFDGCAIKNIKRSVVRMNIAGLKMENLTFNDCEIEAIGTNGYGMITSGKDMGEIGRIEITNSTLVNMGDQLMDVHRGINLLTFANNTIYLPQEMPKELKQVFRFRSPEESPRKVVVSNCIFAGPNKGKKLNSGYGDYSDYFDFSDGNYITSDLEQASKDLTNIILYGKTSAELFADPLNGDFHIKPDAGFAGAGKAGDPRWYE